MQGPKWQKGQGSSSAVQSRVGGEGLSLS